MRNTPKRIGCVRFSFLIFFFSCDFRWVASSSLKTRFYSFFIGGFSPFCSKHIVIKTIKVIKYPKERNGNGSFRSFFAFPFRDCRFYSTFGSWARLLAMSSSAGIVSLMVPSLDYSQAFRSKWTKGYSSSKMLRSSQESSFALIGNRLISSGYSSLISSAPRWRYICSALSFPLKTSITI